MAKWTPRPIRAPVLPADDRTLKFSLKYLDTDHERFHFDACTADTFLKDLVLAMRHYSQFTLDQFTDQNHDPHRHQFDFAGTPEAGGFSNLEEDVGGHLKTGHRWTLQKRPTESGQDTSIYNLNVGI